MTEAQAVELTKERRLPSHARCASCGREILPLVVDRGRTALLVQHGSAHILIHRAAILCDGCGARRVWHDDPVSAVWLGIAEAA